MKSILTIILEALQFLPAVAAGIHVVAAEKDHASKTQMAMDALGISSAIAAAALPKDHPLVQNVTALVGAGINEAGTVVASLKGTTAAPVGLSQAATAVIQSLTPEPTSQDVAASVVTGEGVPAAQPALHEIVPA